MDLSDPTRAVTGTLDGTVLAVLASAGHPLTVGQVTDAAARGSQIGIRRSLARLAEQGIVRVTWMGRTQVHELNREHVAAEVAMLLADLRNKLWARLRDEIGSWGVPPLYAYVFGSAARGDGDVDSDVDLLVVHPRFGGEPELEVSDPTSGSAKVGRARADQPLRHARNVTEEWQQQLDGLRDRVLAWTGNSAQIVELSLVEWLTPPASHRALVEEVGREGIELTSRRRREAPIGSPRVDA